MTNLTILTGRITKDLELKQAGQTQVTNFSMAVDNPFKKDDTSFFDIVAFGKTAQLLNDYCGKGSKVLIEGNLKQDRFQDKEGNNRSVVRVIANRIEFLDSKGNNQPQKQQEHTTQTKVKIHSQMQMDLLTLPMICCRSDWTD